MVHSFYPPGLTSLDAIWYDEKNSDIGKMARLHSLPKDTMHLTYRTGKRKKVIAQLLIHGLFIT